MKRTGLAGFQLLPGVAGARPSDGLNSRRKFNVSGKDVSPANDLMHWSERCWASGLPFENRVRPLGLPRSRAIVRPALRSQSVMRLEGYSFRGNALC